MRKGGALLEITSEIWQVGGSGLTSPEDAAVYLMCFDGQTAIVDAGCGSEGDRLAANIEACGVADVDQVRYLLLTHCHFDHVGGAEGLRNRYGCEIVVHELDAPALEAGDSRRTAANWYGRSMKSLSPDVIFSGTGRQIRLGNRTVDAIHAPGHTPGSVVYVAESDGLRVLFGQDVHGPLHADFGSDPNDYRNSLTRMADLGADVLCEGHYGVVRGVDAVRAFIRSFL
jgi:glyoxylase-like metal-dependent hydrolase (beta-lactamase superfamily II)